MPSIKAVSIAPDALDWLENSSQPRILHVFDQACNLINEHFEILSVVNRKIGNGPFNLVVENGSIAFSGCLIVRSPISIRFDQLHIGNITIHLQDSQLWFPRPDWERLHDRREDIFNQIMPFAVQKDHRFHNHLEEFTSLSGVLTTTTACQDLCTAILAADKNASRLAARQLAGLGAGLTPAGDDFILGAVMAAWILLPADKAGSVADAIVNTAAPLTTSLSAAWLRSAENGEAGILWHEFFDALVAENKMAVQESLKSLLAAGHTSGADALSGFLSPIAMQAQSRMLT